MTGKTAALGKDLRERIRSDPDIILEDRDLMGALISAREPATGATGDNVVDLRGVALERLEARLDRLEETHRDVIAAAYENLAGMSQIHRAIVRMLEPADFAGFLAVLAGELPGVLRVDSIRLVLENGAGLGAPDPRGTDSFLTVADRGFVGKYLASGRSAPRGASARRVALRRIRRGSQAVHGPGAAAIRSEACMRLDLGEGRLPGLLALGSKDPRQFGPDQGVDLLSFFAEVVERAMRRWLG